ncbi:hypothetical protein V6N13_086499 [Hibiscus sabdariffa]
MPTPKQQQQLKKNQTIMWKWKWGGTREEALQSPSQAPMKEYWKPLRETGTFSDYINFLVKEKETRVASILQPTYRG